MCYNNGGYTLSVCKLSHRLTASCYFKRHMLMKLKRMKAIKKSYKIIIGFLILLSILFLSTSCIGPALTNFEETRDLMGTYVRVAVYAEEEIAQDVIDAAFARMEEIEMIASVFDENSEAFQLNRDGQLEMPSAELSELLNLSIEYSELTEGAFDVTCQPLLDLWSYKPDADKQFWEMNQVEQQLQIDETLKLVSSDKIVIGEDKIYFTREGVKITLGGIAKGYAVDKALEVIKGMDVNIALVDAGGDIRTLGSKPDGDLWRISLVNPDNTSEYLVAFNIGDKAITTSGNYERYFDPEKTTGHILNPQTGRSVDKCISVTIIADSCMQADALATGVFVMGPENGMALVESLDNVECFLVDAERTIHESSGLSKYLSEGK